MIEKKLIEHPMMSDSFRVKIYTIGAFNEGHGPALPSNIDDRVAQKTALTVAEKTGAEYIGHLPYTSDRVGEISRDWNSGYIDPEQLVPSVFQHINHDNKRRKRLNQKPSTNIIIISGHGGNNFLEEKLEFLTIMLNTPTLYIPPFHDITVNHPQYGKLIPAHACDCEHSVAAYMGLLKQKLFKRLNKEASIDPKGVLKRWPTLMGLGGYVLPEIGGPRYQPLRDIAPELESVARTFLARRKIIGEPEIGRQFLEKNIKSAINKINNFTQQN